MPYANPKDRQAQQKRYARTLEGKAEFCVAYGKTAEIIGEHFTKGRRILIEGRIKYGKYEKDGHTNYTTDIVIERFEFVESKGEGNRPPHAAEREAPPMTGPSETTPPAGGQKDMGDDFDDDIPF